MDIELLSWLSNFINFMIFAYLALAVIGTSCFSVFQMSLSMFGLLGSIIIQVISISIKTSGEKLK